MMSLPNSGTTLRSTDSPTGSWGHQHRIRSASRGTPAVLSALLVVIAPVALSGQTLIDLAPPATQADFAAGVRALHDFWYPEARTRFQAVQRAAPAFTLGYWGEAMALHQNPFGHTAPPLDSMRAILGRLAPSPEARLTMTRSDHERRYLAALEGLIAESGTPAERHPAYSLAMGDLALAYPQDLEAQAFYSRAILLEAPTFGASRTVQMRTANAARVVLNRNPNHPGALHYFIHGMDSPDSAGSALDAAQRYERLTAGSSHGAHMPSHIYMQRGQWDWVVRANRTALQASETAAGRGGLGDRGLDWHAVDFLVYALLQQGRESEVRILLDRTRKALSDFGSGAVRWYDALWSSRYALEVGTRSDVPLPRSGYSSVGEALAQGLYAVVIGDASQAQELLEEIQSRDDRGTPWRVAALELEAALVGGPEAVGLLRRAIDLQSDLPRPNETPDIPKPPEELLGEVLLATGEARGAISAFEDGAKRWPSRLATLLGVARAHVALADEPGARAAYQRLLDQLRHAAPDHPARLEAEAYLDPGR